MRPCRRHHPFIHACDLHYHLGSSASANIHIDAPRKHRIGCVCHTECCRLRRPPSPCTFPRLLPPPPAHEAAHEQAKQPRGSTRPSLEHAIISWSVPAFFLRRVVGAAAHTHPPRLSAFHSFGTWCGWWRRIGRTQPGGRVRHGIRTLTACAQGCTTKHMYLSICP